jgi:hypothetical protein
MRVNIEERIMNKAFVYVLSFSAFWFSDYLLMVAYNSPAVATITVLLR